MEHNAILKNLDIWNVSEKTAITIMNKRTKDSYVRQVIEDMKCLNEQEFFIFLDECYFEEHGEESWEGYE